MFSLKSKLFTQVATLMLTATTYYAEAWCNLDYKNNVTENNCYDIQVSCRSGALFFGESCDQDLDLPTTADGDDWICVSGNCDNFHPSENTFHCDANGTAHEYVGARLCQPTSSPTQSPSLSTNQPTKRGSTTSTRAEVDIKGILFAKCYERPPDHQSSSCPKIVSTIMEVLGSHLDHEIKATHFSDYYDIADFRSNNNDDSKEEDEDDGKKKKMKVLMPSIPNFVQDAARSCNLNLKNFVETVEWTPGGALLENVPFFHGKREDEVKVGKISGARRAFWEGAYSTYVTESLVHTDTVHIIVDEETYIDSLILGAIPTLHWSTISNIEILADSCNSGTVTRLREHLLHVDKRINCHESFATMTCKHLGEQSESCQCLLKADADGIASVTEHIIETNISQEQQETSASFSSQVDDGDNHVSTSHWSVLFAFIASGIIISTIWMKNRSPAGYHSVPDVPRKEEEKYVMI